MGEMRAGLVGATLAAGLMFACCGFAAPPPPLVPFVVVIVGLAFVVGATVFGEEQR